MGTSLLLLGCTLSSSLTPLLPSSTASDEAHYSVSRQNSLSASSDRGDDRASILSYATNTTSASTSTSTTGSSSSASTSSLFSETGSTFGFRGAGTVPGMSNHWQHGYSPSSHASAGGMNGALHPHHQLGMHHHQSPSSTPSGSASASGSGSRSAVSTAPTSPRQSISSYSSLNIPGLQQLTSTSEQSLLDPKGKGKSREVAFLSPAVALESSANTEDKQGRPASTHSSSSHSSSSLGTSSSGGSQAHQQQTQSQQQRGSEWWENVLGPGQLTNRLRQAATAQELAQRSRPIPPAPEEYIDTSGPFGSGSSKQLTAPSSSRRLASPAPSSSYSGGSSLMSSNSAGSTGSAASNVVGINRIRSLSQSAGKKGGTPSSNSKPLSAEVQAASAAMQEALDGALRTPSPGDGTAGLGITSPSEEGARRAGWQNGEFQPPTKSDIRKSAASAQLHLTAKSAQQRTYDAERRQKKSERRASSPTVKTPDAPPTEVVFPPVAVVAKQEVASPTTPPAVIPRITANVPAPDETIDAAAIAAAHFKRSFTRSQSARVLHTLSSGSRPDGSSMMQRSPSARVSPTFASQDQLSPDSVYTRFFERHTAGRRSRVVSEDDLGHLQWPSSAAAFSRASPDATPDGSSGEEFGAARSSVFTRTTTTRTSSTTRTTSLYSEARGSSKETSPRHSRHASISHLHSGNIEFPCARETGTRDDLAALHDRKRTVSLGSDTAGAFDTFPRRSPRPFAEFEQNQNQLRQARLDARKARMPNPPPSKSAPGSRRTSFHADAGFSFSTTDFHSTHAEDTGLGHRRTRSSNSGLDADLNSLRSLDVAQYQLINAGQLARTLTRQVATPVKPLLQFCLVATISSVAFISLVTFMLLSYFLTFWDDIGEHGRNVGVAAGQARRNLEASMEWGRKMLSPAPPQLGFEGSSAPNSRPESPHVGQSQASEHHTPTFGFRSTLARVVPSSVRSRFSVSDEEKRKKEEEAARKARQKEQQQRPRGPGSFGPRPPLRSLIPSILFTLIVAISASLITAFANYRRERRDEEDRLRRARAQEQYHRSGTDSPTGPMPDSRRRPRREQAAGGAYNM